MSSQTDAAHPADTAYNRDNAIRDLVAIIHARSTEAGEDNPLCEVRLGKNGLHYRFPPKLQAMSRLMKLMGWNEPVKVEVELQDNFIALLARIRRRPASPEDAIIAPATSEPIRPTGPISPNPPGTDSQHDCTTSAQPSPAADHPSAVKPTAGSNGGVATANNYSRDDAVRDLVTIIRARPSEATPDHPLCEERLTAWGSYHRFPSKLAAMTLLFRILGWHAPDLPQVPHDPDAKFKKLAECLRTRS
jgi:hypothetical protein